MMVGTTRQKSSVRKSNKKGQRTELEARHKMIAEAAYYRAEKRGFIGDHSVQDWLDAEIEIDMRLKP